MEQVKAARGRKRAQGRTWPLSRTASSASSREYYGRGPERAKSYMLGDRFVVCVLRDTMTTVERTLAPNDPDMVRESGSPSRRRWRTRSSRSSRRPSGRRVLTYHSQLTLDPDIGFEFFLLEER